MHRKSLEAAEALKNDDSGASDREDTQSKASDVSSIENPSNIGGSKSVKQKILQQSPQQQEINGLESPRPTISPVAIAVNQVPSPNQNSTTPTSTTIATIATHSPPSPIGSMGLSKPVSHMNSSPTHHPSQPSTISSVNLPSHHHLTTLETKRMVPSPPRSNYLHENDTEAFRWVDYNREAISYIRCAIKFILSKLQLKYFQNFLMLKFVFFI